MRRHRYIIHVHSQPPHTHQIYNMVQVQPSALWPLGPPLVFWAGPTGRWVPPTGSTPASCLRSQEIAHEHAVLSATPHGRDGLFDSRSGSEEDMEYALLIWKPVCKVQYRLSDIVTCMGHRMARSVNKWGCKYVLWHITTNSHYQVQLLT